MTRVLQPKRSVKPSRPSYVLEEQIGFILRQVWQRHAAIFAREIGINLTPTQWAALAKLTETGPCSQNQLGRLTAMDVVDDFSVSRSEEDAKVYAIRVKAKGSEAPVPAGRAGAGARCALLVLVQAFRRTTKAPVHLDHPESYLQPSAESALGDVLLAAVRARGTQLLVETHSDRLLRRIQRRIAEGQANRDHVAVYFIQGRDRGSEIRELLIGECGDIANWPREFFGDLEDDLAAIAVAAARRRAMRGSARAEEAEHALLDGDGRLLDGHPARLDLVFGDPAEGQDG